jgi:hypothetical protein
MFSVALKHGDAEVLMKRNRDGGVAFWFRFGFSSENSESGKS